MGTFGRLVFCAAGTQIVGKREKQKGTNGMSHRKALLRRIYGAYYRIRRNLGAFIRWCIFSIIIGLVAGAVGAAFHHALGWATEMRTEHGWTLYFLPLAGLFIAFWYSRMDMPLERGTNFILTSVRRDHPVRLRLAPSIFITSVLTHLCGGSAGREGAAIQLGGAISGNIGHLMHLDDKDSRTITMCGMAAGFAALFGTPLAASVFAMEVVSVGVMYYAALLPCVLASVIAQRFSLFLGGEATAFSVSGIPQEADALLIAKLLLFGAACAGLAALVCIVFHNVGHLFKKWFPNRYVCIAAGGAVVVALTLLLGTRDYNGAGTQVIERAMAGEASYAAFFIKLVMTAVTIGVGYKGGEIVPVLFIGSTFGAAYGGLFGLSASFAAGLGIPVSVFCGVTNSPLTSLLLAYELFGGDSLALFALPVTVAYMLSGYYGLYSEQKNPVLQAQAALYRQKNQVSRETRFAFPERNNPNAEYQRCDFRHGRHAARLDAGLETPRRRTTSSSLTCISRIRILRRARAFRAAAGRGLLSRTPSRAAADARADAGRHGRAHHLAL